ncbi:MAG: PAS domain-containing protein, partial [Opitutaceae bacterium]
MKRTDAIRTSFRASLFAWSLVVSALLVFALVAFDPPRNRAAERTLLAATIALVGVAIAAAVSARRHAIALDRLAAAKDELQANRAVLQRAMAIARMGNWTADLERRVLENSPATARLFGKSEKLLSFDELFAAVHPEDRSRVQGAWDAALRSGDFNNEHRMLVDGRVRWLHVKAEFENDASGRRVRATGITMDVTERREAERAQRETAARLEAFARNLTDVLWINDPRRARQLYVSPAFETLWGRRAADLYTNSMLWVESIHPQDRERVRAEFDSRAELGLYDTDYRVVRPDASIIWIRDRGFPVHDDRGELLYIAGIAEDITERKQMERSLRANEALFRQLAESLPHLVWAARTDGRYEYLSHRWADYTGVDSAKHLDFGWLDQIHPDERLSVADAWSDAVKRGMSFAAEYRIRRADGVYRWFESRAVPLLDDSGAITRWFGSNIDVHDARTMTGELQKLNAELEERVGQRTSELAAANRELEAFSFSVSHDLRAPLRTIDGFSDALIEDHGDTLPDEARRFLHLIRQGSQRMAALIEDLLAFFRLSRQNLSRQSVHMQRIVNEVIEELRPEIGNRAVELEIGVLPRVEADPKLARLVWLNLLSNALKYTRPVEHPHISISSHLLNGARVFEVADNGTGFDMAYADRLFGVFQRLHSDEQFEGTGVGLAIVQRIIHRHGGRIWAKAAVNEGARFSFTLEPGSSPAPPA